MKLLSGCVMARRLFEQSTDRMIEMIAVQLYDESWKFDYRKLCRHDKGISPANVAGACF
jgi:hypothetical protein